MIPEHIRKLMRERAELQRQVLEAGDKVGGYMHRRRTRGLNEDEMRQYVQSEYDHEHLINRLRSKARELNERLHETEKYTDILTEAVRA